MRLVEPLYSWMKGNLGGRVVSKYRYALLGLWLSASGALADEPRDWQHSTLSGDWGGARSRMSANGLDWEIVYKSSVHSSVSGGLASGTEYLGNIDVKLAVDGDKAWGWPGATALLYVLNNHGGKINAAHVGSAQGVDNIEVATNTTKLYQAWLQQSLLADRLSLLAGLYDLNSEFYATSSSGLFLHPAFGIGSELAQTGQNGPSIFPTTSFAVRLKVRPAPGFYAQAVALDGVPGDPNNPHGTHVQFNKGDGALIVGEVGWAPGEDEARPEPAEKGESLSKLAVGLWHYTARFDDLQDTDAGGNPERRMNRGMYVLAQRALYQEAGDASQGLTAFLRFGVASADVNQFDRALDAGLVYRGLLPGRDDDLLGFAIAAEHNGAKFRQTEAGAGNSSSSAEVAYELSYRAQVAPWLAIQPDIQHIVNHGAPSVRSAWIAGVRFEISL